MGIGRRGPGAPRARDRVRRPAPRRQLPRPARLDRQRRRQHPAGDHPPDPRVADRVVRPRLRVGGRSPDGGRPARRRRAPQRRHGGLRRVGRPQPGADPRRHGPGRCRPPAAVDRLAAHGQRPGQPVPGPHQVRRPAVVGAGDGRRHRPGPPHRRDRAAGSDVRLPRCRPAGVPARRGCRATRPDAIRRAVTAGDGAGRRRVDRPAPRRRRIAGVLRRPRVPQPRRAAVAGRARRAAGAARDRQGLVGSQLPHAAPARLRRRGGRAGRRRRSRAGIGRGRPRRRTREGRHLRERRAAPAPTRSARGVDLARRAADGLAGDRLPGTADGGHRRARQHGGGARATRRRLP